MYQKTYAVLLTVALLVLLQSFLPDIAWGVLIAVILSPGVKYLELKMSRGPAIGLTILAFLLVFIVPLSFLLNTLGAELLSLSKYLKQINTTGMPAPELLKTVPYLSEWLTSWWNAHLAVPGGLSVITEGVVSTKTLTSFAGESIGWIASHVFHLFLAFLAAAVFLANEAPLAKIVKELAEKALGMQGVQVVDTAVSTVRATALGLGSVAVLEGVVLGTAYAVAGAPYPVTLGILTVYMAMIPGGAPLAYSSVSAILLALGKTSGAVGLFLWGSFELFMVDKFIRPKLIGHGIGLPFLAVLFGLLGGVTTLGPIGLFVGPMLMALFFNLVKTLHTSTKVLADQNTAQ